MSISKQQIVKIHALKNALSMDDDLYKETLFTGYNVTSSKELSFRQAEGFIKSLETKAVEAGQWKVKRKRPFQDKKYHYLDGREDRASAKQLRKIEGIWFEVSVQNTDEARAEALRKLMKRIVKVDDIKFLTHTHAEKMIKVLEQMKKQKEEQQCQSQ